MNKIAQVPIGDTFFGQAGHFLSDLPGLGTLVTLLLSNAIVVAGLAFVVLVIFAGYKMLSSEGDPAKLNEARKTITFAFVGFIIVIAAYLIVQLIQTSLGLPGFLVQ